jgi:hypothetical protein
MWIFILFFALSEVLFGGLITTFVNLKFLPIFNINRFFVNFPIVGYIMFLLEPIVIIGLLIINNKYIYKNSIYKYVTNVILILILVVLILISYMYYSFNPSFP